MFIYRNGQQYHKIPAKKHKQCMWETGNFRQKRMIHYRAHTPFITLISLAHHVSVTGTTWSHTAKKIFIFFPTSYLYITLHVYTWVWAFRCPTEKKKLYKYTNSILISCFRGYVSMWARSVRCLWYVLLLVICLSARCSTIRMLISLFVIRLLFCMCRVSLRFMSTLHLCAITCFFK